jgi:outer membrane protein assembly factor BamB
MKNAESKLSALIICLLITLTLIPADSTVTPQQTTTLQVSPPETNIDVDSFFDIHIIITNVYELSFFDITLHYDTAKMNALSVTIQPPFDTPPWVILLQQIDKIAGTVHVVCQNPQQSYSGTGNMFKVAYVCSAPGINSPLHLDGALINHGGIPIPYTPIDGTVTQNQPEAPPINVTFRLLAVEAYYSNALSYNFECAGSIDYAMKSAEYFVSTLLGYPNWQNLTTPLKGYKYTSYVHLLSNHTSAKNLPYYRGPPTNSNVVNEIQNFLASTQGPWEQNNLTIRIFYYVGHSGIATPAPVQSQTGFFLALGDRGSHMPNASDPANPSSYQELWDYQLNQTLCTGDLATNNCTLIILDSCRSEAAIQMLKRQGRVILTACKTAELANGWVSNPANWPPGTRDRWSFFTGQNQANAFFGNGTQLAGPLGIIGAITFGCDANNDGWADAKEIFNIANVTTLSYSKGEAKQQTPQHSYGVMCGKIPVVQYNNETAFPYNGRPGWEIQANLTWPGFHNGADRTGKTFGEGSSLDVLLWTQNGIGMNASVVISEYEAIIAAQNGSVYGLDLATGSINWKINMESAILATPYVDKGVIYVVTLGGGGGGGGAGGMLYAIDEATGAILWQYQTPPETGFYASPVVTDGYVFVATTSELGAPCEVSARNQTTGQLLWSRTIETPVKSSPAVKEGMLYFATTAKGGEYGRLHAFEASTGTKLWNYSFGLSNVISTPAVTGDKVFIGCMGGGVAPPGLYAFNHVSGTLLWEYLTPTPVCSSPAVDEANDRIIFGCEDGVTIALNMTGHQKWQRATGGAGGAVMMEAVALSGAGCVAAQGADAGGGMLQAITYYVYWLNETTGELLWQYALDGPPAPPSIADDYLFIGTSASSVYCFGPEWPEHDVTVMQVFPHGTTFPYGSAVTIEYTIKNEGKVAEHITVTIGYRNSTTPSFGDITAFYEDNFILNSGEEITKYRVMFTITLSPGIYKVYGIAHQVNGEDDMADNILAGGSITIEPLNMGGGGGTSHALIK